MIRFLLQKLFARGKNLEQLIVQIVAVGNHDNRGIIQRQHDLAGLTIFKNEWYLSTSAAGKSVCTKLCVIVRYLLQYLTTPIINQLRTIYDHALYVSNIRAGFQTTVKQFKRHSDQG